MSDAKKSTMKSVSFEDFREATNVHIFMQKNEMFLGTIVRDRTDYKSKAEPKCIDDVCWVFDVKFEDVDNPYEVADMYSVNHKIYYIEDDRVIDEPNQLDVKCTLLDTDKPRTVHYLW